jgi:DNA-binding NarL/FixJ family response regulator
VIAIVRAGARATSPRRSRARSSPTRSAGPRRRRGLPPRLAGSCSTLAGDLPAEEVDPELDQLTAREREVLRYIARGYLYKEIALRLHISVKTVEAHVSSVLRKLQLSNRHELSRWAVSRRLVD